MTNIDGLVCTWDFKDRLVAVENAEMCAAYTYDYTDRRILKQVWPKATNSLPASSSQLPTSTLYINKYFEVREHDAPTKYVWNGNTRVARVTGSLNTNVRVQRLRVHPGWNLCSLAVTVTNGFQQLAEGASAPASLLVAYSWDSSIGDWQSAIGNSPLPAGTVLWLQATTNATLTITGTYADPTNRTVTASGDFLPSAGLEAWNILSTISNQPSTTLWTYDSPFTRWHSWLPPPLELQSELPAFLAPGQAVFARADTPAQLEVTDSALRIRYYHQDHLGSSSLLSDSFGNAIGESAFFPFGQTRNKFSPRGLADCYGFAQKESDIETAFCYFEARYNAVRFGRFASVDPVAETVKPALLQVPQRLHPYAYADNRPLTLIDPSGETPFAVAAAIATVEVWDNIELLYSFGQLLDASSKTVTLALQGDKASSQRELKRTVENFIDFGINAVPMVPGSVIKRLPGVKQLEQRAVRALFEKGVKAADKNLVKDLSSLMTKKSGETVRSAMNNLVDKFTLKAGEKVAEKGIVEPFVNSWLRWTGFSQKESPPTPVAPVKDDSGLIMAPLTPKSGSYQELP
jgi:RHS repeat-associated protein